MPNVTKQTIHINSTFQYKGIRVICFEKVENTSQKNDAVPEPPFQLIMNVLMELKYQYLTIDDSELEILLKNSYIFET